ncbi:unnamed protein product [Mucor hiemalis]
MPITSVHSLSIVIGSTITLHGLLSSLDFNTTTVVLALGDFNTRLGPITGDSRLTAPRASFFNNWLRVNHVSLWNQILTPGQYTFESNLGKSIIDFFISKSNIFSSVPKLSIESELNLNTDHHLLCFNFSAIAQPQPLPQTTHGRKIWKLQRLNEDEVNLLYQQLFHTNLFSLHQEVKSYFRNQVEEFSEFYRDGSMLDEVNEFRTKNFRDENIDFKQNFDFSITDNLNPIEFIDRIGNRLEEAIYDAFSNSVTGGTV